MIDKNKVYRTRDDERTPEEIIADPWIRIYATDGSGSFSVHGAKKLQGDGWISLAWRANGSVFTHNTKHDNDLIEVVPPIERWALVRNSGRRFVTSYESEQAANNVLNSMHGKDDYRIVILREVRE